MNSEKVIVNILFIGAGFENMQFNKISVCRVGIMENSVALREFNFNSAISLE